MTKEIVNPPLELIPHCSGNNGGMSGLYSTKVISQLPLSCIDNVIPSRSVEYFYSRCSSPSARVVLCRSLLDLFELSLLERDLVGCLGLIPSGHRSFNRFDVLILPSRCSPRPIIHQPHARDGDAQNLLCKRLERRGCLALEVPKDQRRSYHFRFRECHYP